MNELRTQTLRAFVEALGAKKPTPGGGSAAAVAASLGAAAGAMASIYTTRKKDEARGVAEDARAMHARLMAAAEKAFELADADVKAYADLQRSWKDKDMSDEEKKSIEEVALGVPCELLKLCHGEIMAIQEFLPKCNPMIRSDAYVSIHILCAAGKSAYQTALVNRPPDQVKDDLKILVSDISNVDASIL